MVIVDFRVVPPFHEYTTMEKARSVLFQGYMSSYGSVYGEDMYALQVSTEGLLRDLQQAGVSEAVLQGEWEFGDVHAINDAVFRIARAHPKIFSTHFMALDAGRNEDMASVVEREFKERGFSGVNIQPFASRLPMNDRAWGPVYRKCQELNIPVAIHTSVNFTNDRPLEFGRPLHLSEIACEFPDLTIVANHGGWPWVNELVAVAWKHPHVFIEIGAQSPKYIGKPGTGWEPLMTFGDSVLQDKVLFATDNMLPASRVVRELMELPLKDSVKEKWLGLNAKRLIERIRH